MLWKFVMDDGTHVYSAVRPPAWSDNMASAEMVSAPWEVEREFLGEARAAFRREYGAELHTVTVDPVENPDMSRPVAIKRNARVC